MSNTYFIPPYWIRDDDLLVIDDGKLKINKVDGIRNCLPTLNLILAGTPLPSNQTMRPWDPTPPPPDIEICGRTDREKVSERRQALKYTK